MPRMHGENRQEYSRRMMGKALTLNSLRAVGAPKCPGCDKPFPGSAKVDRAGDIVSIVCPFCGYKLACRLVEDSADLEQFVAVDVPCGCGLFPAPHIITDPGMKRWHDGPTYRREK